MVVVVAWLLAFQHVIDNWTFAIGDRGGLSCSVPRVAALVNPQVATAPAAEPDRDTMPIELIGIERAFTADDVRAMNRGIGVDSERGLSRRYRMTADAARGRARHRRSSAGTARSPT